MELDQGPALAKDAREKERRSPRAAGVDELQDLDGSLLRLAALRALGCEDAVVQELGRIVGAVRPDQSVIHVESGEVLWILQRLEDRASQCSGEIDLALETIIEAQPDAVATATRGQP